MQESDYFRLAIDTAAQSPAVKRKVGAVVVGTTLREGSRVPSLATGFNHNNGKPCELPNGETDPNTIHAEIVAITAFEELHGPDKVKLAIYVTQPPCADCLKAIQEAGIPEVIVVEDFMKFDTEKLRYDLVPPSAIEGLAKVVTHGARKYKENNWRKGEIARYEAALMRHFIAWRKGEQFDLDSGFHHMEHILTNAAFILELQNAQADINAVLSSNLNVKFDDLGHTEQDV